MREQGRDPKQTKSAFTIFGIALIIFSIILTIIALNQKPECVNVKSDIESTVERKPLK